MPDNGFSVRSISHTSPPEGPRWGMAVAFGREGVKGPPLYG